MSDRPFTLIGILHKLIEQETAELRSMPMFMDDGRSSEKRKNDLMRMRKLSKRDAYYRVLHILRGYDTEYPPCVFASDLLRCWRMHHSCGELDW